MAIEIALAQAALTNTSTVDFTSAKLSAAPKGVFAILSDGAANGVAADNLRMSTGFTDGTRQSMQSSQLLHGTSSVDALRNQYDNRVAQREPFGSSSDILYHDSFLASGWRAEHSVQTNSGALALACMFGGADLKVEAGTAAIGDGTQQTISLADTTLTPNVIIFTGAAQEASGNPLEFFYPCFGIAHNTGAGIKQRGLSMDNTNNASSSDPRQIIQTDSVGRQRGTYKVVVDSMSQGQFQITATADSGADDISFLALELSNANIALIDVDMPTATGLHEETGPGFTPKFVLQLSTMLTVVDTTATDSSAGAVNLSLFNDTEAFSYSWADEDAAATMNNQSMTHNRAVYYDDHAGALAFDGTFDSFTANGYSINYATVDGTVRKGFALAIGEAGGGADVTGSGSPQAQSATATGTGIREVTGSGTPQAQDATATATGEREITGSGTPSAQAATASGTGEREITGSATVQSQDATATGSGGLGGEVSGSGSASAQDATATGSGSREIVISAAVQARDATASGTGEREITGSATVQSQSATASGTDIVEVIQNRLPPHLGQSRLYRYLKS